jgi:hypothetical protein
MRVMTAATVWKFLYREARRNDDDELVSKLRGPRRDEFRDERQGVVMASHPYPAQPVLCTVNLGEAEYNKALHDWKEYGSEMIIECLLRKRRKNDDYSRAVALAPTFVQEFYPNSELEESLNTHREEPTAVRAIVESVWYALFDPRYDQGLETKGRDGYRAVQAILIIAAQNPSIDVAPKLNDLNARISYSKKATSRDHTVRMAEALVA